MRRGARAAPVLDAMLWAPAAIMTLWVALHVANHGDYLVYLATRGDIVDTWAVLSLVGALVGIIGGAAAWFFLRRRRLMLAAVLFALPIPMNTIVEASRCDVQSVCEAIGWAALPPQAFAWNVRIRDVGVHDAGHIANKALADAGHSYSAWEPQLVARRWRLETRDQDMARGPYDVIVDARTGEAKVVARGAGWGPRP